MCSSRYPILATLPTVDRPSLEHTDMDKRRLVWCSSSWSRTRQKVSQWGLDLVTLATNTTTLDRIMQVGKKKLALDHVIVQKMDDELGEDVQSILTFGAQQLFQDGDTDRGITCTSLCCCRFLSKLN